jgi:hypothetical protein
MKKLLNIFFLMIVAAFSVWLFLNENAAKPGSLSQSHEEAAFCEDCHLPWQGVSETMCLQCHDFSYVHVLNPIIRFHEAQKFCLECHTEHQGLKGDISKMDHKLLSGDLLCTLCHFDRHDGLFGQDCRECHGIATWKIQGFRHPDPEKGNCRRCHKAPQSHYYTDFWMLVEKGHFEGKAGEKSVSPEECRQCHTTHRWSYLKMKHGLESSLGEEQSQPLK